MMWMFIQWFAPQARAGAPREVVCHQGRSLEVSTSAVAAHLRHGDTRQLEVYPDGDGDGFGGGVPRWTCAGAGEVTAGGDCDDGDSTSFPGAPDTCGDAIDQDCDGLDDVCSDTCTEGLFTFDDGLPPDGWSFVSVSLGTGLGRIANGRLEGVPNHGGASIRMESADPGNEVTIAFDAWNAPSAFGMWTQLYFYTPLGQYGVNTRNFDDQWLEVQADRPGGFGGVSSETVPFAYGAHHHELILRDGEVERRITRVDDGSVVVDTTQLLPGFVLDDVDRVEITAYVTVAAELTWMDDVEIHGLCALE